MFLHEAKRTLRTFLLLRPCSPENSKKVFSSFKFSDNSAQVLSSMHSVQLLIVITRATCGRPSLGYPFVNISIFLSIYLSCRVWENYPEVLAYSFDVIQ